MDLTAALETPKVWSTLWAEYPGDSMGGAKVNELVPELGAVQILAKLYQFFGGTNKVSAVVQEPFSQFPSPSRECLHVTSCFTPRMC